MLLTEVLLENENEQEVPCITSFIKWNPILWHKKDWISTGNFHEVRDLPLRKK